MRRAVGAGLLAGALLLSAHAGVANAEPRHPVVRDGVTQPVFGYADAIRERVYVECTACDGEPDGTPDRIVLDVMRPAATAHGLKVPAIVDASPYYTTVGRGNEGERIGDVDGDGINDRWPLFYDNYFVPRGYAMVLLHVDGTAGSTGCTDEGGRNDIESAKAGIDWLNGRARGFDAQGRAVRADWDNGRAAMIGKSYDGTIANGVAATGVRGLTTIVPISAISSWYRYSRTGGITFYDDYPAYLSSAITDADRQAICAPAFARLAQDDGDESGDFTPFWAERAYDVSRVRASVFASHGINDDNVRPDQLARWWAGLAARGVPRKLWLATEGHVDPFDYRRAEWVATLHRWFDYWLQGVPNGIMREPRVDIERHPDVWETHRDWPLRGVRASLWLTGDGLRLLPGRGRASFVDDPDQPEAAMIADPDAAKANRLAFLSKPLPGAVHVSGTPELRLRAASSTTQTNLGAILVDYGAGTHETRAGDGVVTTDRESCWGETSANDDPCYFEVDKPLVDVDSWAVSKGILDSSNRFSLSFPVPLMPGRAERFRMPLLPTDYVFPAGHRIGVIVVGSYADFPSEVNDNRATITVDERRSRITLPITFERTAPAPGPAATERSAPRSAAGGGWVTPRERRIPR